MTDHPDAPVILRMAEYPLQPGQMLLLGPLSCAYLRGDWRKAPWVIPGEKAPGGKLLPDKFVIDKEDWHGKPQRRQEGQDRRRR